MLTKGGMSQADIASALHASKRDVSAGARAIREYGLTFDAVSEMDVDAIDDLFFPKKGRKPSDVYLQQDMELLVERKKKNRKLPVKLFGWSTANVQNRRVNSRIRIRCSLGCSPKKLRGWMLPGTLFMRQEQSATSIGLVMSLISQTSYWELRPRCM